MSKKIQSYDDAVMWVHGLIVMLTIAIPFGGLLLRAVSMRQFWALLGIGFFVLSGHTLAFFRSYLRYLQRLDGIASFDESTLKKFLHLSIIIDLLAAFIFYVLGMQR